jgi:hypothetical protein
MSILRGAGRPAILSLETGAAGGQPHLKIARPELVAKTARACCRRATKELGPATRETILRLKCGRLIELNKEGDKSYDTKDHVWSFCHKRCN